MQKNRDEAAERTTRAYHDLRVKPIGPQPDGRWHTSPPTPSSTRGDAPTHPPNTRGCFRAERTCYALRVIARALIVGLCLGFPLVAIIAPSGLFELLGPSWVWPAISGVVGLVTGVAVGARITSATLGAIMLTVATHQAPMTAGVCLLYTSPSPRD